MSLDIRFIVRSDVVCPHCGEVVMTKDEDTQCSGGRGWYPLLEELGYYDPLCINDEWYGRDMVLTAEQLDKTYRFVKDHLDLDNAYLIRSMVAMAKLDKVSVVVNADW